MQSPYYVEHAVSRTATWHRAGASHALKHCPNTHSLSQPRRGFLFLHPSDSFSFRSRSSRVCFEQPLLSIAFLVAVSPTRPVLYGASRSPEQMGSCRRQTVGLCSLGPRHGANSGRCKMQPAPRTGPRLNALVCNAQDPASLFYASLLEPHSLRGAAPGLNVLLQPLGACLSSQSSHTQLPVLPEGPVGLYRVQLPLVPFCPYLRAAPA